MYFFSATQASVNAAPGVSAPHANGRQSSSADLASTLETEPRPALHPLLGVPVAVCMGSAAPAQIPSVPVRAAANESQHRPAEPAEQVRALNNLLKNMLKNMLSALDAFGELSALPKCVEQC